LTTIFLREEEKLMLGKSGRYLGGSLFLIGWVLFALGLSTFLCGSPYWGPNCFDLGLLVAEILSVCGVIFVGGGLFIVGRSSGHTHYS
jgi:hypothetical protein